MEKGKKMKKPILVLTLLAATNAMAADEVKLFTMDGEFGFIATSGNTETTSVKGKIAAHQELARWSNDFMFEALYKKDDITLENGEQASQTTAQKYFLSGQGNYKLDNPDHRLFAFASYEDDRFSSFDYQSTIAAGWSQKMWQDDTSQFAYSVGPGYSFAKKIDGTNESGLIARGALDYQWKISDTATFKQLLSTEVGADNTKSKSETSVSAQINGSLSMKVSLIMDHNSDVVQGTEKLDSQTAATVVYTFF
ncbi:MAG: putative salt-induced outer membrane protein [Paraglaciecola sp.]|jgi:putative salt-induced outer membrane protein